MKSSALTINIFCWMGRVLALGLFLFWGAFFVAHLQQWFMNPGYGLPPVWVWLGQAAHLTILVGLAALWWWPVAGSILAIIGSLCFFGGLAIWEATAGKRYLPFLEFLAVTIIPAVLTLACSFARTRDLAAANAPRTEIDGNLHSAD